MALRQFHRRTHPPGVRILSGDTTMPIDGASIITWIIVGGIAGWLAGLLVQGGGFGIIGDIIIGIVGAIIAGYLFPAIGIPLGAGIVAAVIDALIGAVVLILIIRLVRRAA